jgi:sucrose-6-phosphate hydrolase SacC (GH32 family)
MRDGHIVANFRDPSRAVQLVDGYWYMAVGSDTGDGARRNTSNPAGFAKDGTAALRLFRASDDSLTNWTSVGVPWVQLRTQGWVNYTLGEWNATGVAPPPFLECPDLYRAGTTLVLISSFNDFGQAASQGPPFSPPAGFADGQSAEWRTGALVLDGSQGAGKMDLKFVPKHQGVLDYGLLYAQKTAGDVLKPNEGRRVLFGFTGWHERRNGMMNSECGISHVMPRDLRLDSDGRMLISPVREVSNLKLGQDLPLQMGGAAVTTSSQVLVNMVCTGLPSEAPSSARGANAVGVDVLLDVASGEWTRVGYDLQSGALFVDQSCTNSQRADLSDAYQTSASVSSVTGAAVDTLNLTVLVDGGMLESFANERVVITSLLSPSTNGTSGSDARQVRAFVHSTVDSSALECHATASKLQSLSPQWLMKTDDNAATTRIDEAAIGSVEVSGFRLTLFADCHVQATNTHTNSSSLKSPLLVMYNRVADARPTDWEPCVGASAVGNRMLRISAAHAEYGSVDIQYTAAGADAAGGWITFKIVDISRWTGDPKQKHLSFNTMCTVEICKVAGSTSSTTPWSPYPADGSAVSGKLQGYRGTQWATGFLSITSNWQDAGSMYYVQPGWRVAFTLAPSSALSAIFASIEQTEKIATPCSNRARSWLWAGPGVTAGNLNTTIELALELGVELVFLVDGGMSNVGDFVADPEAWPNGLAEAGSRLKSVGLQVGQHMISPGAQVCLEQMNSVTANFTTTNWHGVPNVPCRGTARDTVVSRQRSDIFVPQGLAPFCWHWAQTAGTWQCHEKVGNFCHDVTRSANPFPGSPQPPPANPIQLINASWTKLGRYRTGGAVAFGDQRYGRVIMTPEYDFRSNSFYPDTKSEFTLQLVLHLLPQTSSGHLQAVVCKNSEWALHITAAGVLRWSVHLAAGWVNATGSRQLTTGSAYCVKATHNGGIIRLFSCELASDFGCAMLLESVAGGDFDGGLVSGGPADIIWGAEEDSGKLTHFAAVAVEEAFLSRISLENVTSYLFTCPDTGCYNFYVFDYTREVARSWWANATSRMFNAAGSTVSQWDGAEFQPEIAGWGWPHSSQTWTGSIDPGKSPLWRLASTAAFGESRVRWQQPMAVEMSMVFPGLGEWHGDMAPFGDEALITGGYCRSGDAWLRGMLLKMSRNGLTENAYGVPLYKFLRPTPQHGGQLANEFSAETELDCFIGGLVACGIAPQINQPTTVAVRPLFQRVKFWLNLFKQFGSASAASITILHQPVHFVEKYPTQFPPITALVGLAGGREANAYGLYVGNTTQVQLEQVTDNSTILLRMSWGVPFANLSVGRPSDQQSTWFCASNATTFMFGGFWMLAGQNVRETITSAAGQTSTRMLFPKAVTGQQKNVLTCMIGETVSFAKVNPTHALKSDDGAVLCSATHLYVRPTRGGAAAESVAARGACVHVVDSVFEAKAALRRGLGAGGPRFVNLLRGDHQLSSTLRLGSADSGSADAPIVWRSAPGHHARLTGGVRVPVTAFAPVSVPSGAVGVLQVDLTPLGFNSSELGSMADPHPIALAELFVNGAPTTLARAPNGVGTYYGYENLTNVSVQGFALADGAANSLLRAVLSRDSAVYTHGYLLPPISLNHLYKPSEIWTNIYHTIRLYSTHRLTDLLAGVGTGNTTGWTRISVLSGSQRMLRSALCTPATAAPRRRMPSPPAVVSMRSTALCYSTAQASTG